MVGGLSSLSAPTSQVLLLTGSSCSYTSGEVADVAVSPMDVAKLLEGLLQPKLRVKWLLSASRSLIAEFPQIHSFSVVSVAESQALGCYLLPRALLVRISSSLQRSGSKDNIMSLLLLAPSSL